MVAVGVRYLANARLPGHMRITCRHNAHMPDDYASNWYRNICIKPRDCYVLLQLNTWAGSCAVLCMRWFMRCEVNNLASEKGHGPLLHAPLAHIYSNSTAGI